ncbi:MAG: HD domain-containing protein [Paludibacteraceae bacterium]|nr:HD domain-containing protein [Paludibacteraceae bacterium]
MDYIKLIDKYYANHPALREVLITHSRQVADRALRIVDAHPEWTTVKANGECLVDRQFIEEAAMLHDIGIIFCEAPKIHCHGQHKYIEHGYLGAELLRQEGLPKHALVAERHTGTGITIEQVEREELPIPPRNYCPESLEEKIICYADKFYSKSHLGEEVALSKVRANIWKYGHDAIVRWEELSKLMCEADR